MNKMSVVSNSAAYVIFIMDRSLCLVLTGPRAIRFISIPDDLRGTLGSIVMQSCNQDSRKTLGEGSVNTVI